MSLYNCKQEGSSYRITKFDPDLNPEGSYLVTPSNCECPAGVRPTCRHRKMLSTIKDRANTEWFYDYDNGIWHSFGVGEVEFEMFAPVPVASEASSNEVPSSLNESATPIISAESSVVATATVGNEDMGSTPTDLPLMGVADQAAPGKIWRKI